MTDSTTIPQVDVLDYGGGNLGSLLRALGRLEIPYQRCAGKADGVFPSLERPMILPGVGAFGSLMRQLRERELDKAIQEGVAKNVPYLGVCVGLQVLFEASEESPGEQGLGLLKGKVVRFRQGKIPQIGWNSVEPCQPDWPEGYVYYVNSYYAQPEDESAVLYSSEYEAQRFCGAVRQGPMTAFQFHPEKSGDFGHQLLKHWLQLVV